MAGLNLLQLEALLQAQTTDQLYVVRQNGDYRISLQTLLGLVTKASLGLDAVDNTPDLEKPISSAQQQAFELKADKTDVPTLEAFNALAQALQTVLTQEALDAALLGVWEAVNGKLSADELNTRLTTALEPVNTALTALQQRMSSAEEALSFKVGTTQFEFTMNEFATQFNTALAAVNTSVTEQGARLNALENGLLGMASRSYVDGKFTTIDERLATLDASMSTVDQHLTEIDQTLVAMASNDHTHPIEDVEGLQPILEKTVQSNSPEW